MKTITFQILATFAMRMQFIVLIYCLAFACWDNSWQSLAILLNLNFFYLHHYMWFWILCDINFGQEIWFFLKFKSGLWNLSLNLYLFQYSFLQQCHPTLTKNGVWIITNHMFVLKYILLILKLIITFCTFICINLCMNYKFLVWYMQCVITAEILQIYVYLYFW